MYMRATRSKSSSEKSGLRQSKRLSQVFLRTPEPLFGMIDAIKAIGPSHILEIGPGGGILTRELLGLGAPLTAVEKDTRFFELLSAHFWKQEDKITLRNEDILDFDFENFLASVNYSKLVVVGNIPYHISTPILFKVLNHFDKINAAFFMVQKEFAERLCAKTRTKDYGSLTVYCQLRAQFKIVSKVSRESFRPVPKVDSAIFSLTHYEGNRPIDRKTPEFLKRLENMVRKTFQERRKMLKNTLAYELSNCTQEAAASLEKILKKRPEELNPEEFIDLLETIISLQKLD